MGRPRVSCPPVTCRPLREEDIPAVHELIVVTFDDVDRRLGEKYSGPPPRLELSLARFRRLLASDPGGAWVSERGGELVGCAAAILRERVWGLSLLIVHPSAQGSGVGRELLTRAVAYGEGARGRIILSSRDPRAMRTYARMGLALHPCVTAVGRPRQLAVPDGLRDGGPADLPLTEAVDRAVRGAAHGEDILAMLAGGCSLLVAPGGGYALLLGGEVRLLAAFDESVAEAVLRACLARVAAAGEEAHVEWISASQDWAVATCLEAGLELRTDCGPVFIDGDVGPFRPYLPNGAYL